MIANKRWSVEIQVDEHDTRMRALARLRNRDKAGLIGMGLAGSARLIATCPRLVTSWPWPEGCATWVTSFSTPRQVIIEHITHQLAHLSR